MKRRVLFGKENSVLDNKPAKDYTCSKPYRIVCIVWQVNITQPMNKRELSCACEIYTIRIVFIIWQVNITQRM